MVNEAAARNGVPGICFSRRKIRLQNGVILDAQGRLDRFLARLRAGVFASRENLRPDNLGRLDRRGTARLRKGEGTTTFASSGTYASRRVGCHAALSLLEPT